MLGRGKRRREEGLLSSKPWSLRWLGVGGVAAAPRHPQNRNDPPSSRLVGPLSISLDESGEKF